MDGDPSCSIGGGTVLFLPPDQSPEGSTAAEPPARKVNRGNNGSISTSWCKGDWTRKQISGSLLVRISEDIMSPLSSERGSALTGLNPRVLHHP